MLHEKEKYSNGNIEMSVDKLVQLDETYSAIERELRLKISEVRSLFQSRLDSVLSDRALILSTDCGSAESAKATPGVPRFWLEVLANSEEFCDEIEEYDEPILEYLESIEAQDIYPSDEDKGFVLTFKFRENPFFTNTELRKVYTTAQLNEFSGELEIVKIESSKIEWNAGQDVTVETVVKKKSGGGKKKKAGGAKMQPRPSFFRYFRNLDQENIPSELGDFTHGEEDDEEDEDDMDELERLQMLMEHDWDRANTLKELIIPRAIRWFTGEAIGGLEEDNDDDEEDDEEEDEDDDEEHQGVVKQVAKNPEECKQQ